MTRDPQITELETKVKHLQTNLRRAIEQIQRCDLCRLSLATNNCQPHRDDVISDFSNPLPEEPSQGDAVGNLNNVPPQKPHQVDNACNPSDSLPQEPHQVDNTRNSSDSPPQEPHQVDNACNPNDSLPQESHQVDNACNPSDSLPQEPHQVDNTRNSSDSPQEPHQVDNACNSSDSLPQEPHQGNSNDLPEPCPGDAINKSNDAPGLQFNFYIPKPAKPTKRESSQRWKAHADELVKKIYTVPSITQHGNGYWEDRIRAILLGVSVCNGVRPSSSTAEESLRDFAAITNFTGIVSDFTRQVHAFQQLIFVSACSVLVASGVKTSKVNSIMRLCVTDSGRVQLGRLRNGAQWINEQTSKYVTLGHLPMEYIFRCPMSMNKYGTLAQSPRESENYLGHLVPTAAPEKLPSLPQAYIPLFVPSFVQVMLGGDYTLHEVCKLLKLPESFVNEKTISLCRQYTAIRDAPSQECLLPSLESRKRTIGKQPASGRKSKYRKPSVYEPSTSSTPTEGLSSAFAEDKNPPENTVTDGLVPPLDHIVQGSSSQDTQRQIFSRRSPQTIQQYGNSPAQNQSVYWNNSNTYGTSVASGTDTRLHALAKVAELDSTGYDSSIGSSSIVENSTGIDVYHQPDIDAINSLQQSDIDLINSLHYHQPDIGAIHSLQQSEIDLINSLHYPPSDIDAINSLQQSDIDLINSLHYPQSNIDLINSLHYPQSDLDQISTPQPDHQANIEVVNSRYQQHLDYH